METELLYLGITHRTAPLSVRGAISPSAEKQAAILDRLAPHAPGRMILCTCERFELYVHTLLHEPSDWLARIAEWFQVPVELVTRSSAVLQGKDAARHLIRVAAGLDSRVLGEPQILGQVRNAYRLAWQRQALDPILSTLSRTALSAGKRARTETPLNRFRRSIPLLALNHAVARQAMRLLVLGSGRLAADVADAWSARRIGPICIVARNLQAAADLAQRNHARHAPLTNLPECLSAADVVVACSAAPYFVLDAAAIGASRRTPLCLIDLAVPRNIDPDVALLNKVSLCHLDELLAGESSPQGSTSAAESLVENELNRFEIWRAERRVVPAITAAVQAMHARDPADLRAARRKLHFQILALKSSAVGALAS